MFNKTRRKIVIAVVGSLFVLMAVTLATIYITNKAALQRENEEMLQMYVERYKLENQPGASNDKKANEKSDERPEEPKDKPEPRGDKPDRFEPQFQLSTFYSVAYSSDGEVLSVNNGNNALQSEESLLEIASSILESKKTSGKTGNMTYLVKYHEN